MSDGVRLMRIKPGATGRNRIGPVLERQMRERPVPTINREWHLAHRMPKDPTELQRIGWHVEHARHCGCRGIDEGVARLFEKHGVPVPPPYAAPPASERR